MPDSHSKDGERGASGLTRNQARLGNCFANTVPTQWILEILEMLLTICERPET